MGVTIKAIRGMNDILPQQTANWQRLEAILRQLSASYGYDEIRMPVVESTDLFKRAIGEVTDIVEKEMYTFADINGDSLTLRPEGTASCVRAGIEQGLLYNQIQRLWYLGSMFRHERPQRGRYRQFHQFGIEAFGMSGPDIDAELIVYIARLFQQLDLSVHMRLEINSLGSLEERKTYRQRLVEYFNQHQDELDEDSQRRLGSNPLRILDSKNPAMQTLITGAPKLLDHLGEESQAHFSGLCDYLQAAGISYSINPRLVRGLDYYNRTVFEWITDELGAQGTVCAGGRYDGLVEQLGGKATPAVGFSLGIERLLALLETHTWRESSPEVLDIYMLVPPEVEKGSALVLAEKLRSALATIRLQMDCSGGSLKTQFKRADKSGARLALVMTQQMDSVEIKYLRDDRSPQTLSVQQLIDNLARSK